MSYAALIVPGMNDLRRFDVIVTITREDGNLPDPAKFAVAARHAASGRAVDGDLMLLTRPRKSSRAWWLPGHRMHAQPWPSPWPWCPKRCGRPATFPMAGSTQVLKDRPSTLITSLDVARPVPSGPVSVAFRSSSWSNPGRS